MLSDCCDYPSPRISLIRKHPTSVSHGTGSSPVPPTIQNNNLGGFPQIVSLEFGTVEGQLWRSDNPSVWFTVRKSHPAKLEPDRSSALLFCHGGFNFSSTYSESSTIRSTSCAAGSPAKFRSTSSFT